jgi:hypothetical protein
MKRRVVAFLAVAALSAIAVPSHAQPTGQLVTIDGAFGRITTTYSHLRDVDLAVRNARDRDAALAALSPSDQIAMAYNFLPDSRTSVTFGPCIGGDPEQCDHPADPLQLPEVVVVQPEPISCGHHYEGFSQRDIAQLTLYSFTVDVYRCIEGGTIVYIDAAGSYGDENWGWSCDYDPESPDEKQRWPKNTYSPEAPAQAITVTSVGQCHADTSFKVLGREVQAQWQVKHPKIMVEMRGDGSAMVVEES